MSQPEDIEFSYTKKGFLYQFNARYDFLLNDWTVSFLVYHPKSHKIYLSEYARFRRQILRKLENTADLDHRYKIIDELDYKYVKIISAYIAEYVNRIKRTKPDNETLFEYGKQKIDKLMELIITLKIDDLNVTKIDQKNSITFYFVWNRIIIGTYILNKTNDTDKYLSDY